MRPAVRFGDAEISLKHPNAVAFAFIGLPRSACRVSWPGGSLMLGDGVVEQCLEQAGAFGIGDTPADNAAAKDRR